MTFRGWGAVGVGVGVLLSVQGGCDGGDKRPAHAPVVTDTAAATSQGGTGGNDTGGAAGAPASGGTGGDSGTGGSAGAPSGNCGDITCRGHGHCVEHTDFAECICDSGYVLDGDGEECVVDESCIRVRFLQEGCRVEANGPPAVGLFFAIDFCSGTAVLPEKLEELGAEFQILEDGADVEENVESYATVIDRDVESYVTLAIDVSESVTDDSSLIEQLTGELRGFVSRLANAENPVTVSVLLFGIDVREYVPFTTDLTDVNNALKRLGTDTDAVLEEVQVRTNGTALHDVVNQGIRHTERILSLRQQVTELGVLATGTLVVVTDGQDTGGAELNTNLIDNTFVDLVSVGISADIDDGDLTAIGRNGSFLAPEPEDWADAFDEIAERVEQYPKRAYLLAYCASSNSGDHEVGIRISNDEIDQLWTTCTFNADVFGTDFEDVCDADYLSSACDGVECGGLFACGACASDACCSAQSCHAPAPAETICSNDQQCQPGGGICEGLSCAAPLGPGEACTEHRQCGPGVGYCLYDYCVAVTLENGDFCGDEEAHSGVICPELNCAARNPRQTNQGYVCKPRARIGDACAGAVANAECELGAYCEVNDQTGDGVCLAQNERACEEDYHCSSGACDDGYCLFTGRCGFDWDDRVAR